MNTTAPQRGWLVGSWDFVSTTLPALLLVFLRLIVVLFPIQVLAFSLAYAYFLIRAYFMTSLPQDYLLTVFERLAEWGWTVGLLGTLAIWISERMKWQDKLDGIRLELEEVHRDGHWEKVDQIYKRYIDLRSEYPEARSRNLERLLADGFFQKAIQVEKPGDWEKASEWLEKTFELVRDHDRARRLYRLLENQEPKRFDKEDIECLESLPPTQARSLLTCLIQTNRRILPKDEI